jgi:hypothetical protein
MQAECRGEGILKSWAGNGTVGREPFTRNSFEPLFPRLNQAEVAWNIRVNVVW